MMEIDKKVKKKNLLTGIGLVDSVEKPKAKKRTTRDNKKIKKITII